MNSNHYRNQPGFKTSSDHYRNQPGSISEIRIITVPSRGPNFRPSCKPGSESWTWREIPSRKPGSESWTWRESRNPDYFGFWFYLIVQYTWCYFRITSKILIECFQIIAATLVNAAILDLLQAAGSDPHWCPDSLVNTEFTIIVPEFLFWRNVVILFQDHPLKWCTVINSGPPTELMYS